MKNCLHRPLSRLFHASKPRGISYWDAMALKETERNPPVPLEKYQRYDSISCSRLQNPPTCARMLSRDFIDDALYNPNYGYFSRNAQIFSPEQPFDFSSIRDTDEFMSKLASQYRDLETHGSTVRQLWHTPTEIFKPWYGYAVAKYIVSQHDGSDELIIYEIGAGNGTLMNNILDYIQQNHPDLYKKTRYNIIEISKRLAQKQTQSLPVGTNAQHVRNVKIVNQSILDWNDIVSSPCYFIATEVLDNMSHDVVRYGYMDGTPYQAIVLINEDGDYTEAYEPVEDALILRYMKAREDIGQTSPLLSSQWKRRLRQRFPLAPNLTQPEFLPTMTFRLLEKLNECFPRHRLIISDFDMLPDAVEGVNGPVVQTRYDRTMVACSTYLVQPGYFDIFFPTDFKLLKALYQHQCGKEAQVMTQRDFLKQYADLNQTQTKSGENPLLNLYENVSFLLS